MISRGERASSPAAMEQAQRAPRNGGQVKRIVGKIVLTFVIATSHRPQIPHVLRLALKSHFAD